MTFSKALDGAPLTLISSLKWSTDKSRLAFPFGANLRFGDRHVLQAVNDGEYTHLLFTRLEDEFSASLMLARTKYLGVHLTFQF